MQKLSCFSTVKNGVLLHIFSNTLETESHKRGEHMNTNIIVRRTSLETNVSLLSFRCSHIIHFSSTEFFILLTPISTRTVLRAFQWTRLRLALSILFSIQEESCGISDLLP